MKEAEKLYETVDEYMQLLPDDIKPYIIEVRNTIQKSLPNRRSCKYIECKCKRCL